MLSDGKREHELLCAGRAQRQQRTPHLSHSLALPTLTRGAAIGERFRRVIIIHQAPLPAPPRRRHRGQPAIHVWPALHAAAGAGVCCEDIPPGRYLVTKGPGLVERRPWGRGCYHCRCCCCCCSWCCRCGSCCSGRSRRSGHTACRVASRRRHGRLGWAGPLLLLPGRRWHAAIADQELRLLRLLWLLPLGRLPTAALEVASRAAAAAAAAHPQPDEQHCATGGKSNRAHDAVHSMAGERELEKCGNCKLCRTTGTLPHPPCGANCCSQPHLQAAPLQQPLQ